MPQTAIGLTLLIAPQDGVMSVILESVTTTALARSNETIRSVGTLFAI